MRKLIALMVALYAASLAYWGGYLLLLLLGNV